MWTNGAANLRTDFRAYEVLFRNLCVELELSWANIFGAVISVIREEHRMARRLFSDDIRAVATFYALSRQQLEAGRGTDEDLGR